MSSSLAYLLGNQKRTKAKQKSSDNGNVNVDMRNINIELQKLELCAPDCTVGRHNTNVPMVPCGLCDTWFHIQCLGLPVGTPRSIRGLYFCQDCLGALRELRWVTRRHREREARLEALEALVASLGVEQAQLKQRQNRLDANVELGERVLSMGASLIKENAELRCEMADKSKSESETLNLVVERADQKRAVDYSAMAELQRLIFSNQSENEQNKAVMTPIQKSLFATSPTSNLSLTPYMKRRFLSTFTASLKHQDDDNYIYCDDCRQEFLHSCPKHPAMNRMHDTIVADNDTMKAEHSLPQGLSLRKSALHNAGTGVFTSRGLPKGQTFGPYVGRILTVDAPNSDIGDYCWQIRSKLGRPTYVDGHLSSESNWMRYVNSANFESQRNLVALQYKGHIFYRVIRPLTQGTELLVWYGNEFADVGPIVIPTWNPPAISNSANSSTTDQPNQSHGKQISEFTQNANRSLYLNSSGPSNAATVSVSATISSRLHKILEDDVVTDRKFHCHVCNTSFMQVAHLNRHQQAMHGIEAGHWCHPCGLQFKEVTNLRDHQNRKHGVKPASAALAAVASTSAASPNVNETVHCDSCKLRFASRSQLMCHVRNKQCQAIRRPPSMATTGAARSKSIVTNFQCPYCPAQFTGLGYLINHQKTKHAEMPKAVRHEDSSNDDESNGQSNGHFCDYCHKRFMQESSKKRHMGQCLLKPSNSTSIVLVQEANSEPPVETVLLDGEAGNWNSLSEAERAQLATLGYSLDTDVVLAMPNWNDTGEADGGGDFVVEEEQPMEQELEDPNSKAIVQLPEQDGESETEPYTPLFFVDTEIDTTSMVTLD